MEPKIVKWLRQEIALRGWSIREAARRAGISHTALNNALSARGSPTLDTYRGLARAFDLPLEDVLRSAGELPPTVDEQRALNPTLDEGIRLLTQLPPGDQAVAVRTLSGLRLTARTLQEAELTQEIEQMFGFAIDPALLPEGNERQVYIESLKTLVRLSTPEQLAQMEEWFRKRRAELDSAHDT